MPERAEAISVPGSFTQSLVVNFLRRERVHVREQAVDR